MSLDDLIAAMQGLPALPPVQRAERARALIDESKAVLSLERALAIAEAREAASGAEVGRQLGITAQAIAKTDRLLLRRALELLAMGDVSSAGTAQLMAGLRDDVPVEAVARRVVHGARHVRPGALDDGQAAMVAAARRRAEAIVGDRVP